MSKKPNRHDYIFTKKNGETLQKLPGVIDGLDFLIDRLKGCQVNLFDHCAQVFVDDSEDCKITIGPTASSIFIRDCKNIEIACASSQLRISDSTNITVYAYSQTEPAIERSSGIIVGPYNVSYPKQDEHFEAAKLDIASNKWSQVFDFNDNKEAPNWRIMRPDEFPGVNEFALPDYDAPVNPVPLHRIYGGTLDEELRIGSQTQNQGTDGSLMSFGINVTKREAEQVIDQSAPQTLSQTNDGDDFDDMFGAPTSQSHPPASNNLRDSSPTRGYIPSNVFQGQSDQSPEPQPVIIDQEEVERQERLRGIEEARLAGLQEKQRQELEEKERKRKESRQYLDKFRQDREVTIQKRREMNKSHENTLKESKNSEPYKSSWDKIVNNVAIKEGEYPGSQDVTRMRQTLINKRHDSLNFPTVQGFLCKIKANFLPHL
eukprot:TRINITY_DN5168_c0_g2_i3.p1 TRINITY_DN5168_c0_g2~~TRINITY_DN5168_c0_g2_i3.p1  ORF type:complete len:431 (-),score=54.67 TRINITY_DN5168_c0_g2_i3:379-1671(-)